MTLNGFQFPILAVLIESRLNSFHEFSDGQTGFSDHNIVFDRVVIAIFHNGIPHCGTNGCCFRKDPGNTPASSPQNRIFDLSSTKLRLTH